MGNTVDIHVEIEGAIYGWHLYRRGSTRGANVRILLMVYLPNPGAVRCFWVRGYTNQPILSTRKFCPTRAATLDTLTRALTRDLDTHPGGQSLFVVNIQPLRGQHESSRK